MSYYFTGNVFTDRFNTTKVHNADWGDPPGVVRDDFERAVAAYDKVRARSPNYVQTLNQLGNLYFRHGDWLVHQGRAEEGQRDWDKALDYYKMYHNIDPVFAPNYYAMARIYILRGQYDKAIEAYRALIDAKECRVDPRFLRNLTMPDDLRTLGGGWIRDAFLMLRKGWKWDVRTYLFIEWMRDTLLSYQPYVLRDGQWVHLHEAPQTYTDLGGAYWMKGDFADAEKSFHEALALDPNFAPAKENLQRLYGRVHAPNAGRQAPVGAPSGSPAMPPVPSFELIPPHH